MTALFILGLKGPQLILVVLVVLLLFGANKIPTIMRNLGKGLHSFRQGIEDAKEEMNKEVRKATDDTKAHPDDEQTLYSPSKADTTDKSV